MEEETKTAAEEVRLKPYMRTVSTNRDETVFRKNF
jgi:hypothetical protein